MMKKARRNIPCSRSIAKLVAILLILLFAGCDEKTTERGQEVKSKSTLKSTVSNSVVARVDGVEISGAQVKELIDSLDGGLTADQAVDALIENELLAAEARRRGLGAHKEVTDAKTIELARALLKTRIKNGVTIENVDDEKLKALYEENKEHFVHGVQRRVSHILVHTGNKGVPREEAATFATEIAEEAALLATEDEFVELFESVKSKYPKKMRLESLEPFSAQSKRFVSEFVKATFAIPGVGQTSPPVKTEYGWHVIFVVEELPSENRSFEDGRDELAEKVLPIERQYQTGKLLKNLIDRGGVFLHNQDAPSHQEPSQ